MKYIKLFKNDAEYQAFRGGDYITPNLCLNSETWETKCEPEEVSIFPEGFFPLYLYADYCNNSGFAKNCTINPCDTTIKLYEILKTICEEYGTKNPYNYYINDINLDIYLDDIKICNMYIYYVISDEIIYIDEGYLISGGGVMLYKTGEVSFSKPPF